MALHTVTTAGLREGLGGKLAFWFGGLLFCLLFFFLPSYVLGLIGNRLAKREETMEEKKVDTAS
jgi:flagellar biogenesis protein FliO